MNVDNFALDNKLILFEPSNEYSKIYTELEKVVMRSSKRPWELPVGSVKAWTWTKVQNDLIHTTACFC